MKVANHDARQSRLKNWVTMSWLLVRRLTLASMEFGSCCGTPFQKRESRSLNGVKSGPDIEEYDYRPSAMGVGELKYRTNDANLSAASSV